MNHYTNPELSVAYQTVALRLRQPVDIEFARKKQLEAIDRRVRAIAQCETSIATTYADRKTLKGLKLPGFDAPLNPQEVELLEEIIERGPEESIAELLRRADERRLHQRLGERNEAGKHREQIATGE